MPDNPYVVVGSPNYAAPLLDFSALSGQKKQQQNGQQQQNPQPGQPQPGQPGQPGQPNNPAQNFGTSLRNFAGGLMQYFQPQQQQGAPVSTIPQTPGAPINLAPGSVAGANQVFSGIY